MPLPAFALLPLLLLAALLLLSTTTLIAYLYYTIHVLPYHHLQPQTFQHWLTRMMRVWLRGRYVLLVPIAGSEVGVGWRDKSVSLVG